jgi:hydroxymethylpyrimidine pyrophosphatase-like HAD family hydrolase
MTQTYRAIATDGDGTLLRGGRLGRKTLAALSRWRAAGGKVFLVTGETPRELEGFPHLELFDRVIAENGALLLGGEGLRQRRLCRGETGRVYRALARTGIPELKRGRVIVQAACCDEAPIRKVLKKLRSRWEIEHNHDEMIIAPPAVNKPRGLASALKEFRIPPRQVVGIGDAENDIPLLEFCGLGVAVQNATAGLKSHADLVLKRGFGSGIVELIEMLLSNPAQLPRSVERAAGN